jgi:hypothetical protein
MSVYLKLKACTWALKYSNGYKWDKTVGRKGDSTVEFWKSIGEDLPRRKIASELDSCEPNRFVVGQFNVIQVQLSHPLFAVGHCL